MFDAEWPDPVAETAAYLTAALDVPVRWAVPNPRPTAFVVVRLAGDAGGPRWAERAALDVECWHGAPHGNPKPAHTLSSRVKRALLAAPAADNRIGDAWLTGRAFMPDPDSACPRVVLGAVVLLRPYAPPAP
jgi:hypothetical protein